MINFYFGCLCIVQVCVFALVGDALFPYKRRLCVHQRLAGGGARARNQAAGQEGGLRDDHDVRTAGRRQDALGCQVRS